MILSKDPNTDTKHVGTNGPFSKLSLVPPKVFCCYSAKLKTQVGAHIVFSHLDSLVSFQQEESQRFLLLH